MGQTHKTENTELKKWLKSLINENNECLFRQMKQPQPLNSCRPSDPDRRPTFTVHRSGFRPIEVLIII